MPKLPLTMQTSSWCWWTTVRLSRSSEPAWQKRLSSIQGECGGRSSCSLAEMRILLVSHYFEPENSAPQRRWSAHIREWTSNGHEVTVFAPPPHYPAGRVRAEDRHLRPGTVTTSDCGARVFRTHYLPHGSDIVSRSLDHIVAACSTYLLARRAVRRGAVCPDMVIGTAPAVPSLLCASLLARSCRVPFVAEMRDAWPDLVTHLPGFQEERGLIGRTKSAIHRRVTKWQRGAALVVTTTTAFADVLQSRGISRVAVVRNGTNPARYEALRDRHESNAGLRVLYIGNMGRSQGLETVLRAVAELKAGGVPVTARFVGFGVDVERLKRLNRDLGYPVEIHGGVAADEVAGHYEWADSIIVSLRNWKPFEWTVPSKLFDALASGRHVTGLIAGEAADLLLDASAGDVVAPGDQDGLVGLWKGLVRNPERLSVGNSGKNWVRLHASNVTLAARYLALLQEARSDYSAG